MTLPQLLESETTTVLRAQPLVQDARPEVNNASQFNPMTLHFVTYPDDAQRPRTREDRSRRSSRGRKNTVLDGVLKNRSRIDRPWVRAVTTPKFKRSLFGEPSTSHANCHRVRPKVDRTTIRC
jgi:hypothetical protein